MELVQVPLLSVVRTAVVVVPLIAVGRGAKSAKAINLTTVWRVCQMANGYGMKCMNTTMQFIFELSST